MIRCQKCGKEVDTLAKRRHRCKRKPAEDHDSTTQKVFWIAGRR